MTVLALHAGDRLSHYRLAEKIGEGGMGVVYKALDTKLRRHVAIKVLPDDLMADPERRRRFLQEARSAAAVTHPNIATIHEIDEAEGVTFIVMELVEGKTLRSLIRDRPLPIPEALRLAAETVEGLAEAHRARVVHRDLKPDNVVISSSKHVKILDFGLAKLIEQRQEVLRTGAATRTDDLTRDGTILGTTAYMSPEQARGDGADARSDIFSFGITLYEIVTGRVPFQGHNQVETLAAILHQPVLPASRLNPDVPSRLEAILGKCLEKDPDARYQSSDELLVDLRQLDRTLVGGPSRQATGHRARRLASLVGVAVLVVAGALFTISQGPQPPAPATSLTDRSAIAVLPFQNLSADAQHAYFAGGLHDEVLTQLSKVAALKVISRTSVMGYQGTPKPLKAIAAELGVGSLLEGSVQVVSGRLRVTVKLIAAATDESLWAERYDRTLDDAFAIQSEVAQQIVAAAGVTLTGVQHETLTAASTSNPEAYRLYLQGREYWSRPGDVRQDQDAARQLYERALVLDPDFALAHAALSMVHGRFYWYRWDPSPERAKQQLEEAEAALRLAPDLPQAHVAMGLWHYWGQRDYRKALDEFGIALEGLPNDASVWSFIGAVHRRLGNWSDVAAAFEKVVQLNPRDADAIHDLGGFTFSLLHRYGDAVREYDRALILAPDLREAEVHRGWAYFHWQGRLDTLRDVLNRLPTNQELGSFGDVAAHGANLLLLEHDAFGLLRMLEGARDDAFVAPEWFLPRVLYVAWAHRMRGDDAAARAAFDAAVVRLDSALAERPDDYRLHAARGMALAGLGRRDEALGEARWLEQSVEYREDALLAPGLAEDVARILAQIGEAEAALDEIEPLLAGPSDLSVHELRLDPRWDPLRDHPRFVALLSKFGSGTTR